MTVLLIRNAEVYAPEPVGKRDILCVGESIASIKEEIPAEVLDHLQGEVDELDGSGCIAVPGFVDQHVHFNGAGGGGGPKSRTVNTPLTELTLAGITTAVGLLGTDGIQRSLPELLQKARGLEEEGITTWMFTGSYQIPSPTITGDVTTDITFIDKIIGLKLSMTDHRSSNPTVDELRRFASKSRLGGLLGGKCGLVMVHLGVGKVGMEPLYEVIRTSDIPIEQFIPTHINRAPKVMDWGVEWGKNGGYVDISSCVSPEAGFVTAIKPGEAVKTFLEKGVKLEKITVSSDGNGAMPILDENGKVVAMAPTAIMATLDEFEDLVNEGRISIDMAVKVYSTNIARHLNLAKKGVLGHGMDADILLFDKKGFEMRDVIARGKIMVKDGLAVKKGIYGDGPDKRSK